MQPIQMTVTFEAEDASAICEAIGEAVARCLPGISEESAHKPPASSGEGASGVVVTDFERLDAHDLRAAYLLGKLPEDGGLLVDKKSVSKLLNISPRSVDRLWHEKAMPNPIKISRQNKWRVREIIEWVEADCPPQKYWRYSGGEGKDTRKRKRG